MNLLRRSLLLIPALFLAPLSASAAAPYYPYCVYKCTSQSMCETSCWDDDRSFTTCGAYFGTCTGPTEQPSKLQASVQPAPESSDEASDPVCREPEARG